MQDREFRVALHPAQQAIYNSSARFKVAVAGRRFGKSYYAAAVLGVEALRNSNDRGYELGPEHPVYYIAPTFDQAKRIMWRRLRKFLAYEASGGFIRNENVNDGYFELINGRRIYIKGADNKESLRGEGYSFVVMDEYADMSADVWEDIIDPALMDVEGGALFIGTPKGKNHFYKLFSAALTGDKGPLWEAFHFKSSDNPYLKKSEIDRIRNDPNKSRDIIRQELDASFVSGDGKVLKRDDFKVIPSADHGMGTVYVTVDLAGFNTKQGNRVLKTDESVICATLVKEDEWTVLEVLHGHWDVRETALNIVLTLRKYSGAQLGIEQGALANAVGPYLEEYMRSFQRYVTPQPLRHNNQRKTDRIVWALQGRSQRGKIKVVRGDWNEYLLGQVDDFPDPLAHDDAIDALAYVDQLYHTNFVATQDIDVWQPLDLEAGY
jgi:Terminase large subunit, T4likevirus-type, N-terminal